ncbi:DUF883 domain-containing protein [uncultured Maritimibacter sp.]|jgi:ElaB/YqjD/DUF883 family membrane-anchored ribosome-binding protein|uniref:glycine zipper domain-containing protein n=1 Tax=uncultured Maritimibacter sp. TaxID=991866 RepID=UPI0026129781|nr:DUF883 domain-containing protein [uncultured Maritimibacter sp.]
MATATQTAKNVSNGIDRSMKDLEAQIAALKSDVSELTTTLGKLGKEASAEAKSRASKAASSAKDSAYSTANAAGAQAREYYGQAEAQVRENPAAAVGIAAGVGFLVGLFMARK